MLLPPIAVLAVIALCLRHSLLSRSTVKLDKEQNDHLERPLVDHHASFYKFPMPVDHFNASVTGTYDNRYWVDDTFYKPGGPVIFCDGGEAGVTEDFAAQLLNETGGITAPMELARKYDGLVVLWEHRYFGQSLPFRLNSTDDDTAILQGYLGYEPEGAPASFEYNTVEQGLEDVVYFANNLNLGEYSGENFTALLPRNTPWIWIGGSYAGDRGAWMRVRSPEIIYAAWVSSAPVEMIFDGSTYYHGALMALPSNCAADVKAIVHFADHIMSGTHGDADLDYLKKLAFTALLNPWVLQVSLGGPDPVLDAPFDNVDIAFQMQQPFSDFFQSYGPSHTTNVFCDALQSYAPNTPGEVLIDYFTSILTNPGTAVPSSRGIVASNNNNLTLGMEAYFFAYTKYRNYTFTEFHRWEPREYFNFAGDGSAWEYLVATQFGWYQGSNVANITIVSSFANVSAKQHMDQHKWLSDATIASLPERPNVDILNKYGGWNMNPANTMFTDGSLDPWRAGSVYSLETELGASGLQPTTIVPRCGQQPADKQTRFGILYAGEVHAPDLWAVNVGYGPSGQNDTPSEQGLTLFMQALDEWLPCFGHDGANGRDVVANGTNSGSTDGTTNGTESDGEGSDDPKTGAATTSPALPNAAAVILFSLLGGLALS